jgi:hypothetical protein
MRVVLYYSDALDEFKFDGSSLLRPIGNELSSVGWVDRSSYLQIWQTRDEDLPIASRSGAQTDGK